MENSEYIRDLYERLKANPNDMGVWADLQELAEREEWERESVVLEAQGRLGERGG